MEPEVKLMNYDGIRAVRIYDDGFINGILVERDSRKWDYVLTMRGPLKMIKIPTGDCYLYQVMVN